MITTLLYALVLLALAVVCLVAFQRTSTTTGRIITGIAAMLTGVLGLILLPTVVFAQT